MRFTYPLHIQSIARLREDLERAGTELNLPGPELRQIRLIAEELFSRMVRQAPPAPEEEVAVILEREEGAIGLEIAHPGTPNNPLEAADDQGPDPLMQEEAGMGLALIEAFTDRLEYHYDHGVNRVRIRKDIRSKNA